MAKEFLPYTSLERLYRLRKKEKSAKAQKRLRACILRKKGKTLVEISDTMSIPYTTVQNWMARVERNGIRDRHDKKIPGAACKLDAKQQRQLVRALKKSPQKCGYDADRWTMEAIRKHIKETFKVEYNVGSVWELAVRLGFDRHCHSASYPISSTVWELAVRLGFDRAALRPKG